MNGNFIQGLVGVSKSLEAFKKNPMFVNVEVLGVHDTANIVKDCRVLLLDSVMDAGSKETLLRFCAMWLVRML